MDCWDGSAGVGFFYAQVLAGCFLAVFTLPFMSIVGGTAASGNITGSFSSGTRPAKWWVVGTISNHGLCSVALVLRNRAAVLADDVEEGRLERRNFSCEVPFCCSS